jgi:hypothetical protein
MLPLRAMLAGRSSADPFLFIGGEKTKRAPSAYNVFVKEQMKVFKEEFPDKPHKEAMSWVCAL